MFDKRCNHMLRLHLRRPPKVRKARLHMFGKDRNPIPSCSLRYATKMCSASKMVVPLRIFDEIGCPLDLWRKRGAGRAGDASWGRFYYHGARAWRLAHLRNRVVKPELTYFTVSISSPTVESHASSAVSLPRFVATR
jgi:hypothetical protein